MSVDTLYSYFVSYFWTKADESWGVGVAEIVTGEIHDFGIIPQMQEAILENHLGGDKHYTVMIINFIKLRQVGGQPLLPEGKTIDLGRQ